MTYIVILQLSLNNLLSLNKTWKQSAYVLEFEGSFGRRLGYVMRMAAYPNFIRSCGAFLIFSMTMYEQILIFQTFGTLCSFSTISTFLIFNLLLPPMLYIHENYLADRGLCKKKDEKEKKKSKSHLQYLNNKAQRDQHSYYKDLSPSNFEKNMLTIWSGFVDRERWHIMFLCLAWTILATVNSLTNTELYLNDNVFTPAVNSDHNITKFNQLIRDNFESPL